MSSQAIVIVGPLVFDGFVALCYRLARRNSAALCMLVSVPRWLGLHARKELTAIGQMGLGTGSGSSPMRSTALYRRRPDRACVAGPESWPSRRSSSAVA